MRALALPLVGVPWALTAILAVLRAVHDVDDGEDGEERTRLGLFVAAVPLGQRRPTATPRLSFCGQLAVRARSEALSAIGAALSALAAGLSAAHTPEQAIERHQFELRGWAEVERLFVRAYALQVLAQHPAQSLAGARAAARDMVRGVWASWRETQGAFQRPEQAMPPGFVPAGAGFYIGPFADDEAELLARVERPSLSDTLPGLGDGGAS